MTAHASFIPDQPWITALETLHRAATNEDAYLDFLDQAKALTRSRFMVLGMFDPHDPERHAHRFSAPRAIGMEGAMQFLAAAAAGHEDGSMAIQEVAPQTVLLDFDVYDDKVALDERPTMKLLESVYGARHIGAVNAQKNRAWVDYFMFAHSTDDFCDPERIRAEICFLVPHIGIVSETRRAFRLLELQYKAVFSALDHLGLGVALVTDRGSVFVKNATLERILERADGIRLTADVRLRAVDGNDDAKFQSALAAVLGFNHGTTDDRAGPVSQRTMIVQRSGSTGRDVGDGDDDLPYLIDITPLRQTIDGELNENIRGALVFVVDPDDRTTLSHLGLTMAFGLTETESAVCRAVLDGQSNRGIADERAIALQTVKTHISSVFAKTGTANRAALTRLAAKVSPPIKSDPEA